MDPIYEVDIVVVHGSILDPEFAWIAEILGRGTLQAVFQTKLNREAAKKEETTKRRSLDVISQANKEQMRDAETVTGSGASGPLEEIAKPAKLSRISFNNSSNMSGSIPIGSLRYNLADAEVPGLNLRVFQATPSKDSDSVSQGRCCTVHVETSSNGLHDGDAKKGNSRSKAKRHE